MWARIIVGLLFVAVFFGARFLGVGEYLSLMGVQMLLDTLVMLTAQYPVGSMLVFMLVYVLVAAFSLPVGAVLTMLGGALFGALGGTSVVVVAATIGALFAFLSARFVVGDVLQARYGVQFARFNAEIEAHGMYYLFTLRLLPVFPFFLVNLLAGLSRVPIWTFVWTTTLGIIPGTFVYAFAGRQLATITDLSMLLTPGVIAAFTLLGFFSLVPVVWKKVRKQHTPQ